MCHILRLIVRCIDNERMIMRRKALKVDAHRSETRVRRWDETHIVDNQDRLAFPEFALHRIRRRKWLLDRSGNAPMESFIRIRFGFRAKRRHVAAERHHDDPHHREPLVKHLRQHHDRDGLPCSGRPLREHAQGNVSLVQVVHFIEQNVSGLEAPMSWACEDKQRAVPRIRPFRMISSSASIKFFEYSPCSTNGRDSSSLDVLLKAGA